MGHQTAPFIYLLIHSIIIIIIIIIVIIIIIIIVINYLLVFAQLMGIFFKNVCITLLFDCI